MNDHELWAAIDAQRQQTAELLEQLTDDEWSRPSLCAGWTIRDVAAHLTLQQQGITDVLGFMIKHPGSLGGMNRMINRAARIKAECPIDQLIGEIRATIGSRRHNLGITPVETLIDIVVHGQDIAIPLGRELDPPPTVAAIAATRVRSYGGKGKAAVFDSLPLGPYRLIATDLDWSDGDGPEIQGPMIALLLLLAGRRAALPRLQGPGVAALRERYPAT